MLKRKTSLRRFVAVFLTGAVLAGNVLAARAEVEPISIIQEVQLAYLYSEAANPATFEVVYEQRIAQNPQDIGAYAGRAVLKKAQLDTAGAKADLDTVLGQLETENPLENITTKMIVYPYRAEFSFELCDQTQYLNDARAFCDLEEQYLNLMSNPQIAMGQIELAGQIGQVRTQLNQKREALQQIQNWYNNGSPAVTFTADHAVVTGGKGNMTINIREEWNDGSADAYTLYDTTFQLSQPIQKVARRCATSEEEIISALTARVSEGVCYQVPAGTVITMCQSSRFGKSSLQTDTSFSYQNNPSGSVESLTVEAGKTYTLDYAGFDSVCVVFTGV